MPITASPFKCAGAVQEFPPIPKGKKLIVRLEKLLSSQVNLTIDEDPSAINADYFLTPGDSLEIPGENHISGHSNGQSEEGLRIKIINILLDPFIYWRIE